MMIIAVTENVEMKIREYIVTQDEDGMFHFGDELVRCKDCKKQSNLVCNYLEGLCALQSVKPNDFCSYGERREE